MKYFYYLCILVTLSNCTTSRQTYIPTPGAITYGIDLTKYADEKFLITPFEYRDNYLTVGMFTTEIIPEITQVNDSVITTFSAAKEYPIKDGYNRIITRTPDFNYVVLQSSVVDYAEVIETAYQFVISVKGDAIMQFTITTENREGMINGSIYEYTVNSVKGIAIRRGD